MKNNMFYEFQELALDTAQKLRTLTFQADTPLQAVENALYTAKLKNSQACTGRTNKVVYPDGRDGNLAWVLSEDSHQWNKSL